MSAGSIVRPEFTGIQPGEQLFDVWDSFYTEIIGSMFPRNVALPIGGIPTAEGEAIFGAHFDRMERTEREWRVASRLYTIVKERLDTVVPLDEEGEIVLALPRQDFTEEQNRLAQEGMLVRGLSAFLDRSDLDFPQFFDASRDLPRYTRVLENGLIELTQEQDLADLEAAGIATRGAFVAVKRLFGPTHQKYQRDLQVVEMRLAPHSLLTDGHQEHPAVKDTFNAGRTLDMDDDAIVERLNGQRPRPLFYGSGTLE